MKDLIVCVADSNMKHIIEGILKRDKSLHIKNITYKIIVHPERDPGCYSRAHEFLRPFHNQFRYALTIFDYEGSGRELQKAEIIQEEVENNLTDNGWGNRAKVTVVYPEVDIWIWANSPHVCKEIGWKGDYKSMINYLKQEGFECNEENKPIRPKEALEFILKENRIPRSSSIYYEIASHVSLEKCTNNDFLYLKNLLQEWFGL